MRQQVAQEYAWSQQTEPWRTLRGRPVKKAEALVVRGECAALSRQQITGLMYLGPDKPDAPRCVSIAARDHLLPGILFAFDLSSEVARQAADDDDGYCGATFRSRGLWISWNLVFSTELGNVALSNFRATALLSCSVSWNMRIHLWLLRIETRDEIRDTMPSFDNVIDDAIYDCAP